MDIIFWLALTAAYLSFLAVLFIAVGTLMEISVVGFTAFKNTANINFIKYNIFYGFIILGMVDWYILILYLTGIDTPLFADIVAWIVLVIILGKYEISGQVEDYTGWDASN